MTIIDRIDKRLKELGLSRSAASLKAGLSVDAIRNLARKPDRVPQGDTLSKLAAFLNVSTDYLLIGDGNNLPEPNASSAQVNIPAVATMPRDVPVFGTASGSAMGAEQGAWQMTSDPVDYVRRAPGLATARDAYALYVENDSMEPRFPPGELVFIHPGRPVRSGDVVVIQTQNAEHAQLETYIKILVRRANGDVVCRQYNPNAEIRFKASTVISVHRVLTMAEVLGT